MPNHPTRNRSRLAQYGTRLRTIDGRKTVEMVDPTDNARRRHQYRRTDADGIERRVLRADGTEFRDGSPWEPLTGDELRHMLAARGDYHPILSPLGL